MAELTISTFVTLDGVMQATGAPTEDTSGNFQHGGWVFPLFDEDLGATMNDTFSKADAFLLGRTIYDIFSAYWPKVTDPKHIIAAQLNRLPKFVSSRTKSKFDWHNSTHVKDVINDLSAIKQRFSGEVQVHGSCGLAQTLIAHDLIDEYRLLTFPVVLGTGKRLFGSATVPTSLNLVTSKTTSKGVVISVYRRRGALKTASFD